MLEIIDYYSVNRHLLVDDKPTEDNTQHIDRDVDIFQGLEETVKAQKSRKHSPTFLRVAPARPLTWPSSKSFEALDFFIDKLESSQKSVAQGRSPKALPTF